MRIAISGSHATGKSTLARNVIDLRPAYSLIDEPYHVMVSEGYLFSDPPTPQDYEAQLERSVSLITANSSSDVILERCPVDFLAYLAAFPNYHAQNLGEWLHLVNESIRTIDLVVYVPVENPDRVEGGDEYPKLRRMVDRRLRAFLMDDELGIVPNSMEVRGSIKERVRQLLARME